MGILQLPVPIAANTGVVPNIKTMTTTDNLTTITTAGYMNQYSLEGYPLSTNDLLEVMYAYNPVTQVGTLGRFSVSITNGVITLVSDISEGNVVLPTTANHIAVYSNTTGEITEDASTAINAGNLQAGLSGTSGACLSFPPTAGKGALILQAQDNTGNYSVFLKNASFGQTTSIFFPDQGASSYTILNNTGPNLMAAGSVLYVDKGAATVVSGACTLNKQSGIITTESLTNVQYAVYSFVINNSFAQIGRCVLATVDVIGGSNTTVHGVTVDAHCGTGQISISLTNLNSTQLNGTYLVNFAIVG